MPAPDRAPGGKEDLARSLRAERVATGLSQHRLAELALMAQSKLSRIESGRRVPSVADVERLTAAAGSSDATRARLVALAEAANSSYRPGRFGARAGIWRKQDELAALERSARHLRYFLPAIPTGLLHTPEYALATLHGLGVFGDTVCEQIIAGRLARQQALAEGARRYSFLLTEQAVRAPVAPDAVMAGQLERVREIGQLPGVDVAVLPFALAPWPVMPLNTFVVYDDLFVTAELFSGEVRLHDPQDVARHLELFERLHAPALKGRDAAAFLDALAAVFRANAASHANT